MRILYGGAFNPPTLAHYQIIKYLLNKFCECQLILLPTNNFYKKKEIIDFHHRVKMLELMINELNDNRVRISDYELTLDKYYGSYYTLSHFNHPYFVIGADALESINSWIRYPEIVMENKFIVFPRDDLKIDGIINNNQILKKYEDNFIIIDNFETIKISSTMYRNQNDSDILVESVAQYIKEKKLYEVI